MKTNSTAKKTEPKGPPVSAPAPAPSDKPPVSETPKALKDVLGDKSVRVDTGNVAEEEVAEFLRTHTNADGTSDPAADPEVTRVDLPPAGEFSQQATHDQIMQSAFVSLDKVLVTEEEKSFFIKDVLLMDHPFITTIPFCNGQFNIRLRSRTMHEQSRVFELMERFKRKDPTIEELNFTLMYFFYMSAALMITHINDRLISELKLIPGDSLEVDMEKMSKAIEGFKTLPTSKWIMYINAMRVMEAKMAKLDSLALDESFWTPRNSQA